MGSLENDCISILDYACKQWPRWVPISEFTEVFSIPPSTIRTIFMVADRGIFVKYREGECFIRPDVFDKIARKYGYSYKLKKFNNSRGIPTWNISVARELRDNAN